MVREIQPPLIVFPNRDKDQLKTNIGSESSISLLKRYVISMQNHHFTRKGVRVNPQKVHPNPPIIKRIMALERVAIF